LARNRRVGGRLVQRIQKALESVNIKLTSVISNIVSSSGRRILKAMIAGETNATKLAELGSTRLKCAMSEACQFTPQSRTVQQASGTPRWLQD
jgi:hypothetical protein